MNKKGNPKIAEKGKKTRFSKTNQPKNKGQRPNHLKDWMRNDNIGVADVKRIISTIVNCQTIAELKKLRDDNNTPPIIRIPIKAILAEYRKNKVYTWNYLLEYAYGKSIQAIDIFSTQLPAELTREERQKRIDELIKKRNQKKK